MRNYIQKKTLIFFGTNISMQTLKIFPKHSGYPTLAEETHSLGICITFIPFNMKIKGAFFEDRTFMH